MSRQTESRPGTQSGTAKKIQQDAGASTSVSPTVPVVDPVRPWLMAMRTVVSDPDGFKSVRFHMTAAAADRLVKRVAAQPGSSAMTSVSYLTRAHRNDANTFVVVAENKARRTTTTVVTNEEAALKKARTTWRRGLHAELIPCRSWPTQPQGGGVR